MTVITVYVLWKFLKDKYINNDILSTIRMNFTENLRQCEWTAANLLTHWYALFAQSRALISSISLTAEQSADLNKCVIEGCKAYQFVLAVLIEAKAAQKSRADNKKAAQASQSEKVKKGTSIQNNTSSRVHKKNSSLIIFKFTNILL